MHLGDRLGEEERFLPVDRGELAWIRPEHVLKWLQRRGRERGGKGGRQGSS